MKKKSVRVFEKQEEKFARMPKPIQDVLSPAVDRQYDSGHPSEEVARAARGPHRDQREQRIVKRDPLAGFLHPADAIVPCSVCGATEGIPCRSVAKDKDRLKPGFVHFGRRVRRFLLTGGARSVEQRKQFEDEAVKMLCEYLAERQPSS